MEGGPRRHLVCPSGCRRERFELIGAPVLVDAGGRYLSHDDRQASFRCVECQAVAVDLAAAAAARARDTGYAPESALRCPGCGEALLAPEEQDERSDLECPSCGAIFSWDEGSPSVLGRYSMEEPEEG